MSCRRKTDAPVSLATSLLQCEMQARHIRVDITARMISKRVGTNILKSLV